MHKYSINYKEKKFKIKFSYFNNIFLIRWNFDFGCIKFELLKLQNIFIIYPREILEHFPNCNLKTLVKQTLEIKNLSEKNCFINWNSLQKNLTAIKLIKSSIKLKNSFTLELHNSLLHSVKLHWIELLCEPLTRSASDAIDPKAIPDPLHGFGMSEHPRRTTLKGRPDWTRVNVKHFSTLSEQGAANVALNVPFRHKSPWCEFSESHL